MGTVKKWIYNTLLIWKKERLMNELMNDNLFFSIYFQDTLKQDEGSMVDRLNQLSATPELMNSKEAKELQAKIVEIRNIKSRLDTSKETFRQLGTYIEMLKKA